MAAPSGPTPRRVLIVDDVKGLRELYRILLAREGRGRFEVVGEAADGAEAIRLVRETRPDLVLLDISMPMMDGLEALPSILRESPASRVVMLSGFESARLEGPSLAGGASAYIEKGVSPRELVDRLLAVFGERVPSERDDERPPAAQPEEPAAPAVRIADAPRPPPTGDARLDALQREVASLREANRELESFAYTVAHDLRAPLRGLEYFARVLQEDAGPTLDEASQEILERMRAESTRLSQLIDSLLAFARLSRLTLHHQKVDLSALAEAVVRELLRSEPERRVDIRIEPGLRANGDASLLRLVLENLLGNAWKFTRHEADACIELGTVPRGPGEQAFFVRDNGAGFSQADAGRLFQPFQRLHAEREFTGTGVGLASARRIVERHGGTVWAEGEVGVGATFYFSLPERESPEAEEAETRQSGRRRNPR